MLAQGDCSKETSVQFASTKWLLNLHFDFYFTSKKFTPFFLSIVNSCPPSDLPARLSAVAFKWGSSLPKSGLLMAAGSVGWSRSVFVLIAVCGCSFMLCAVKRNESRGLLFGCFLAVSTLCLIALEFSATENSLLPPLPLSHRNEGALRPAEHAGMKTVWDFYCKNIYKNIFEGINNPYHCRIQIFWLLSLYQMPSIAPLEYCCFSLKTLSSIVRMKGHSMY